MADPKIDQLRHIKLFERCSKDELKLLAHNTDEVDLKAGRTLITEGKLNDTFYLVLDGELEVKVDGNERRHLGPGDVFGEISMLSESPATATVTTLTPVRALVMSHMQFRDSVRAREDIAVKVIAVMAEHLLADHGVT
jgi:CRP-like cAMP-binding protein